MVSGFLSFTEPASGYLIARRRAASIASFRFRSFLLHPHTRTTAVLRENMMVSTAALLSVSPAAATLTDPIFPAIEAHKAAFQNCVSVHSDLERAIPRNLRQSSIDA
jgi:hypothetical protein